MLTFQLPLPPSVNHLWATVGSRRVKTKHYKSWIDLATIGLLGARPHKKLWYPVEVEIRIWKCKGFSTNRDIDNIIKPVLDVLVSEGVIDGDTLKYVRKVSAEYISIPGSESCSVVINESISARALAEREDWGYRCGGR